MACTGMLCAHDSPEHEIEALTAKMESEGRSAALLARRASEWRALRKLDRAYEDLAQALALEPGSIALRAEMARVQAGQGNYEAALRMLDQSLQIAADEVERAAIYMQRAEVLEAQGKYGAALQDCERAFRACAPAADWYLTRARLQAQSGQWRECAGGLKEGFEKTGSIVLEIEWIEAMIDAGQCEEALKRIEPHVEKARWKAGWLIRRGRAQAGSAEAEASLKRALSELEMRFNPARPDATLLADRGLAMALRGDRRAATEDLAQVRRLAGESGILLSATARLERAIRR